MSITDIYGTAQPPVAIFDTCEYCKLPILPGEIHGSVVPGELRIIAGERTLGPAGIQCVIRKLQMVEEVVHTPPTPQP